MRMKDAMYTITTTTVHETTNNSYESMLSGSHRAAIVQIRPCGNLKLQQITKY